MLVALTGPSWIDQSERDLPAFVVAVLLAILVHGRPYRPRGIAGCGDGFSRLRALYGPGANLLVAASSVLIFALVDRFAGTFLQQFMLIFVMANATLAVLHLLPVPPLAAGWILLSVMPRSLTEALFVRGVAGECLLLGLVVLPFVLPGFPAPLTLVVDAGQDFVLGVFGALYRSM
jgi:Zn-dependent protease